MPDVLRDSAPEQSATYDVAKVEALIDGLRSIIQNNEHLPRERVVPVQLALMAFRGTIRGTDRQQAEDAFRRDVEAAHAALNTPTPGEAVAGLSDLWKRIATADGTLRRALAK